MGKIEEATEQYANLQYTVIITKEDDGHGVYYVARIEELPGLIMTGDTPEEASEELELVKREWIGTNLKLGNQISLPRKSG
jgi:predicted RNase H-like HicB family nuclease